jgi:hypothetical protein
MNEQCLYDLEENYDDKSHANSKLAKHIKMILTQFEQMTESNIHVSTNIVTRSGKVKKGPVGPSHWEVEKLGRKKKHKR